MPSNNVNQVSSRHPEQKAPSYAYATPVDNVDHQAGTGNKIAIKADYQTPEFDGQEIMPWIALSIASFRNKANIFAGMDDGFLGAMTREYGETHLDAAKRLGKRTLVHLGKGAMPDIAVMNLAGGLGIDRSVGKAVGGAVGGLVADAIEATFQGVAALTNGVGALWHLALSPGGN